MFEHHKESIENLKNRLKDDPDVISIILGGSVAKGLARIDSDIDAIVVVSESRYRKLSLENRLSECITDSCTYEGGYFDIKYCTKSYLQAAAANGSEPSRSAFLCARCVYTVDAEVPDIISQIPVFQKSLSAEKMLSFYSAIDLNTNYFWNVSGNNLYLKSRAASDIVLFGFRLMLQEAEVLFPCHKSLLQTMSTLRNRPEGIIEKCNRLLTNMDDDSKNDFVSSILSHIQYRPPADYAEVLTRFIEDNELWWYKDRPIIAEW
ncbi:MAG: nucleotidyltransferase domain-containing protein [Saccharofermentanales bacterium]